MSLEGSCNAETVHMDSDFSDYLTNRPSVDQERAKPSFLVSNFFGQLRK